MMMSVVVFSFWNLFFLLLAIEFFSRSSSVVSLLRARIQAGGILLCRVIENPDLSFERAVRYNGLDPSHRHERRFNLRGD